MPKPAIRNFDKFWAKVELNAIEYEHGCEILDAIA
jgi:hypothetical protein